MFSIDCGSCPARPNFCDGCILSVLDRGNLQVDELSLESCGYVLDPEVRDAIDLLRGLGMVSTIEILDVETAA